MSNTTLPSLTNPHLDINPKKLIYAIRSNDTFEVLALIDYYPDIIAYRDDSEWTALMWAASKKGRLAILRALLETGKSCPECQVGGENALTFALEKLLNMERGNQDDQFTTDQEEKVRLLIAIIGRYPASVDFLENRALRLAINCRAANEFVQSLLNTGKSCPECIDKYMKQTVLMDAVGNSSFKVIQLLLNTGKSCPECKNKYGNTAADMALLIHRDDIYNLIYFYNFKQEVNKELQNIMWLVYDNRSRMLDTNQHQGVLWWEHEYINETARNIVNNLKTKYNITKNFTIESYTDESNPTRIHFTIIMKNN